MKPTIIIRQLADFEEIVKSIDNVNVSFTSCQAHYVDNITFSTEFTNYIYNVDDQDPCIADDAILLATNILDKLKINYPQLHKYYSKGKLNKNLTEIKVGE